MHGRSPRHAAGMPRWPARAAYGRRTQTRNEKLILGRECSAPRHTNTQKQNPARRDIFMHESSILIAGYVRDPTDEGEVPYRRGPSSRVPAPRSGSRGQLPFPLGDLSRRTTTNPPCYLPATILSVPALLPAAA